MLQVLETKEEATLNDTYRERAYAEGRKFGASVDTITDHVRSLRDETERISKVPDSAVEAMTRIGVFRALTPRRFGGLEMDPASFFEGVMKIAQAEASAAWIGGQLTIHSFEIALMSPRMQEEFWATGPDTRASSAYAPVGKWRAVDGGYVLNGTWVFSSGVDHAQWIILGGGDRNFVVPKTDYTIDHGSWDVQGLRGTGSKSVTLEDVFVPEYRTHQLNDTLNGEDPGLEINKGALYRLSFMGMFGSVMPNSAIGVTLGGLQDFIDDAKVRLSKRGSGVPVYSNPFMHLRLSSALTKVRTARLRHIQNWRDLFDMACRGEPVPNSERLRVWFESTDIAPACFDAFCEIWPVVGAGGMASSNHLQRVFRDLLAMRNHGSAFRETGATMYMSSVFDLPTPPVTSMATLAYYC